MSTSHIELVCFDLGRVLVRIADDWLHACALASVAPPAALSDPEALSDIRTMHVLHESGRLETAEFDRHLAARTGMRIVEAAAVADAWIVGPFEGTRSLVREVAQAGVQTACLSNTNARHWRVMGGSGLRGLPLADLDYRFASHLIGAMKPSDAPYEFVERTTSVPPGHILFFDDLQANVDAARARGWGAVRIERDTDPIAQMYRILANEGVLTTSDPGSGHS